MRTIEADRDLAVQRQDYAHEQKLTIDLQYNNLDTISRVIRMPFGLLDTDEANLYQKSSRHNKRIDETKTAPTFVFWIIFTVLIVIIGFNGIARVAVLHKLALFLAWF